MKSTPNLQMIKSQSLDLVKRERRESKIRRWRRVVQLMSLFLFVVLGGVLGVVVVGGWPIGEPFGMLQVALAARRFTLGMIVSVAALLVAGILLGRFICGWLCPFGNLIEFIGGMNRRKIKVPGIVRKACWLKHSMLGATVVSSIVIGAPAFCLVCPARGACGFASGNAVGVMPTAMLGFVLLTSTVNNSRFWCRYLCPLGSLFSILGRFSPIRLIRKEGCNDCGLCEVDCPIGLTAKDMESRHPDCLVCGECVGSCPKGLLRIGVRK